LRPRAGKTVEKPRPVVPGCAAPWVGDRIDELAYALERLDVLCVAAQRELDLGLLDDSIDPPQLVRLRVRHSREPLEGSLELSERLGIGPPSLRLFGREDGITDGLFPLRALTEVVRQELDNLVQAAGAELLEPPPHRGVVDASPALEEARVRDVLGQRVLERVD